MLINIYVKSVINYNLRCVCVCLCVSNRKAQVPRLYGTVTIRQDHPNASQWSTGPPWLALTVALGLGVPLVCSSAFASAEWALCPRKEPVVLLMGSR